MIVVVYSTDHDPRHAHVFEDGKRLLTFDLESWTVMEGKLTSKARKALEVFVRKAFSMRNPKFNAIKPNYRKGVLEITLQEGRKRTRYNLPFAALKGTRVGPRNRFVSIDIDEELGRQGATFVVA